MPVYEDNALLEVSSFTRQVDGDEVVIGLPDLSVFLVLPGTGLGILDDLAQGRTVGEARELYRQRHGEVPDMDDFLGYLERRAVLRPQRQAAAADPEPAPLPAVPRPVKFHFDGISQAVAKRVFGRFLLGVYAVLISLAVLCIFSRPGILPGSRVLVFQRNLTLMSMFVLIFSYFMIFVHEMGHLVAAKAVGVKARFGVGNRLWTMVAETDMSGLWGVPKRQRYLPLLAGPLVDLTSASILVLLLFGQAQGWLMLPPLALKIMPPMLFIYMMSLLWQFFFFVRTDLYYVIATFFGCKNLLGDTETYLRNCLARGFKFLIPADQSHIPAQEMKVIRAYSMIWIVGRIAALWALLFIHVPILINYFHLLTSILGAGYRTNPRAYLDALLMATILILPLLLGFWLWIRGLLKNWIPSRLFGGELPRQ